MSVNVLGGSLEFDATVNTTDLEGAMTSVEAEIRKTIESFQELASKSSQSLDEMKAKFAELEKQETTLRLALDRTTDPEFVKQYNAALSETVIQMKQLQQTIRQGESGGTAPATTPAINLPVDPQITKSKIDAEDLEKELDALEKQSTRLKTALSNALNPELVEQYNKGLADTEARMKAIFIQLDAIANEETPLTPSGPNPVPPPTPGTPTPPGEDPEEKTVEKKIMAYQQLQTLKNKLASMDKNDPAFKATYDEAVKLQGQINNVNRSLQLTSRNVVGIEALTQGARALVGAFQAYNGILGLTTDDQEQLQKSVTEVVSAMGVLNGIQEIAAVLDKNSSLNIFLQQQFRKQATVATTEQAAATEVLAGAQEAEAVATGEAVVAQEALNVAMESNPVGIILLALTAIVVALQAYASSQKDVTEEQIKANEAAAEAADTLAKLANLYRETRDAQAKAAGNAVSLAQAQGKSEQTILALKRQQLQAELTASTYALAQLGYNKQLFDEQKATLELRYEELQALQSVVSFGGQLSDQSKKREELLQAEIKALEGQVNPIKAILQANDALNAQLKDNQADADKKAFDASLKSAEALADAKVLLDRKYTQQALDDEIAAIKARTQVELDNANLTAGEKAKINAQQQKDIEDANRNFEIAQLNKTKDILDAQLNSVKEGSAQELQLRVAVVEKEAEVELKQADITEEKKIDIRAAANKKVTDLTKQFALQNAQTDIETTIAGIDTQLANVQKGSQAELQLKKQLVDQEAALEVVQSQERIKNENLLAAKILEINAKSAVDKKKLDDDYIDHIIANQLKAIQVQANNSKETQNAIINDPFASASEKYQAIRQNLTIDADAIQDQINVISNAILKGNGDINKLIAERRELAVKLKQVNSSIDNTDKGEDKRQVTQLATDLSSISGSLNTMGSALQGVNPGLADLFDNLSLVASFASKAAGALLQFSTGNIVGGVASTIGAVASLISGLLNKDKQAEQEIAALQTSILVGEVEITRQYDQRIVDQTKLNALRLQGIRDEQKALQQQASDTQSEFDSLLTQIQKLTGTKLNDPVSGRPFAVAQTFSLAGLSYDQLNDLFLKGQLSDKAKALFEELEKLKQDGADVTQALADAKDQLDQIFTGTTADDIASSIIDGFKQGKRGAEDFADDFQTLMTNALLSSLQSQTLEPALQQFYEQFSDFSQSDNVLTSAEIAQLQTQYNEIINNAAQQFQQLQQIAGTNLASNGAATNSLSGAIKGITEDQAELLAGQFGGLRITAVDQLKVAQQNLDALNIIVDNTGNLLEMRAILRRLELNGIKIQ